jgi:hypothetical protein
MEKVKLTSSVDENIIIRAKKVSKIKHKSLLEIGPDYLLVSDNKQFIEDSKANALHGILKETWTDDEIKEMMANDKLGQ